MIVETRGAIIFVEFFCFGASASVFLIFAMVPHRLLFFMIGVVSDSGAVSSSIFIVIWRVMFSVALLRLLLLFIACFEGFVVSLVASL